MREPNFFVVGQTKSGTTSLKHYLAQHPDIFLIHRGRGFFGYEPAEISESKYFSFYKDAKNEKMVGEKASDYLSAPNTASKLKKRFPDAKIIMNLRNPIDMMYALHSSQLYKETMEDLEDFEEAIKAEKWRKKENEKSPGKWHPHMFYSDIAKYTPQVKRYFDNFDKEKIKIVISDDLKKDTLKTYKEILSFLDVDDNFVPDLKLYNTHREYRSRTLQAAMKNNKMQLRSILGKIPGASSAFRAINQPHRVREPMTPELRKKLQNEFLPEIKELGELIGRDLTFWCKN